MTACSRNIIGHLGRFIRSRGGRVLLHVAVSLAILTAIFFYKRIDVGPLRTALGRINGPILAATIICSVLIHIFVGAHKLWRIMCAMGVDISYGETLKVRLGAGPLRLLVPLDVGEVVNVLYFFRRKKMPLGHASGAIALDKGLNLIGVTYWLLLGLIVLPSRSSPSKMLLTVALGVLYIGVFFWVPLHNFAVRAAGTVHPKLGRFVEGLVAPLREFPAAKKLYFLLYGFLFNLRPLAVCFLLFRAHGVHAGAVRTLTGASLAILAGHIPGSLVGIGPREFVFLEAFTSAAPSEVIFSVALMMTLTVHIIPMVAGIPWLPWFVKELAQSSRAVTERPVNVPAFRPKRGGAVRLGLSEAGCGADAVNNESVPPALAALDMDGQRSDEPAQCHGGASIKTEGID